MKIDSSDKLIRLIKSLSLNEKRHFKLIAQKESKGKKAAYMQLYNVIEKAIDDAAEKEHFKIEQQHLIEIKNLSFNKRYLFLSILKSLRVFHANSDRVMELYYVYIDAVELRKKGLNKEAFDLMEKASKSAKEFQLSGVVLMFVRQQIETIYYLHDLTEDEKFTKIEELLTLSDDLTESYSSNIFFTAKRTESDIISNFSIDSVYPKHRKRFYEIVNDKRMRVKKNDFSFYPEMSFNDIMANYHSLIKQDHDASSRYYGETIQLFLKNPAIADNYQLSIYPQIFHFCSECLKAKKFNEVEKYLAIFKNDPFTYFKKEKRNEYLDAQVIFICEFIRIQHYLFSGNKNIIELENEYKKRQTKYAAYFLPVNSKELLSHLIVCFFVSNEYNKALQYIKKLIVLTQAHPDFLDTAIFALIFKSIIYYETEQADKIEFSHSNTLNFLNNCPDEMEIYRDISTLISKELPIINSAKEVNKRLSTFQQQIIRTEKAKSIRLNPFIKAWIKSKVEQKPFSETIKIS